MLENKWRDSKLRPFLNTLPECEYFIKEAVSIRALPDIIGVWRGLPFYLEVKRSISELSCPRTKLQDYTLKKFEKAGAFSSFIYPENVQEVLKAMVAEALIRGFINIDEKKELFQRVNDSF